MDHNGRCEKYSKNYFSNFNEKLKLVKNFFLEITDYDNWLLLTPGPTCTSNVGLPGNAEGFHGGEVRIELGSECQTSDAVLRTMLLHAAGLIPVCFVLQI